MCLSSLSNRKTFRDHHTGPNGGAAIPFTPTAQQTASGGAGGGGGGGGGSPTKEQEWAKHKNKYDALVAIDDAKAAFDKAVAAANSGTKEEADQLAKEAVDKYKEAQEKAATSGLTGTETKDGENAKLRSLEDGMSYADKAQAKKEAERQERDAKLNLKLQKRYLEIQQNLERKRQARQDRNRARPDYRATQRAKARRAGNKAAKSLNKAKKLLKAGTSKNLNKKARKSALAKAKKHAAKAVQAAKDKIAALNEAGEDTAEAEKELEEAEKLEDEIEEEAEKLEEEDQPQEPPPPDPCTLPCECNIPCDDGICICFRWPAGGGDDGEGGGGDGGDDAGGGGGGGGTSPEPKIYLPPDSSTEETETSGGGPTGRGGGGSTTAAPRIYLPPPGPEAERKSPRTPVAPEGSLRAGGDLQQPAEDECPEDTPPVATPAASGDAAPIGAGSRNGTGPAGGGGGGRVAAPDGIAAGILAAPNGGGQVQGGGAAQPAGPAQAGDRVSPKDGETWIVPTTGNPRTYHFEWNPKEDDKVPEKIYLIEMPSGRMAFIDNKADHDRIAQALLSGQKEIDMRGVTLTQVNGWAQALQDAAQFVGQIFGDNMPQAKFIAGLLGDADVAKIAKALLRGDRVSFGDILKVGLNQLFGVGASKVLGKLTKATAALKARNKLKKSSDRYKKLEHALAKKGVPKALQGKIIAEISHHFETTGTVKSLNKLRDDLRKDIQAKYGVAFDFGQVAEVHHVIPQEILDKLGDIGKRPFDDAPGIFLDSARHQQFSNAFTKVLTEMGIRGSDAKITLEQAKTALRKALTEELNEPELLELAEVWIEALMKKDPCK